MVARATVIRVAARDGEVPGWAAEDKVYDGAGPDGVCWVCGSDKASEREVGEQFAAIFGAGNLLFKYF